MTYKWTDTSKQTIKFTDSNNKEFFIPVNEANTDYQEYLAWVSKGNTAEEAD